MRRQNGFTYLGLLILVAIIGLVGAASLKVGSLLQRAAAEEELLEIGAQFSQAFKSYAEATPRGQPRFPRTLNDLLRDPRVPGVRRHLRRVFVDPVSGKAEWGLITLGENSGLLGVYSLSDAAPLKQANFDSRFTGFENKKKISEWKFMMPGQALVAGAGQPGALQPGTPPNAALPSLFGGQRPGMPAQPPAQVLTPPAAPEAPPPQAAPPAPVEEKPQPEATDGADAQPTEEGKTDDAKKEDGADDDGNDNRAR